MQISKVSFGEEPKTPEVATEPKKSSALVGAGIGLVAGGGTGYLTRKTIEASAIQELAEDKFQTMVGNELKDEQATAADTIKEQLKNKKTIIETAQSEAVKVLDGKKEITVTDFIKAQGFEAAITDKDTLTNKIKTSNEATEGLETASKAAKTKVDEAAKAVAAAAEGEAKTTAAAAETAAKAAAEKAAAELKSHKELISKMEDALAVIGKANGDKITEDALKKAAETTANSKITNTIADAAKTLADKLPKVNGAKRAGIGAVIGLVAGAIIAKIYDSFSAKKETPAA